MAISGTVPLSGPIAPTADTDTYPVQFSKYGRGGHHEVADAAARNAITTLRRVAGMLATTQDDGQTWKLNAAPWAYDDDDWSAFGGTLDGDVTGASDDNTVVAIQRTPVDATAPAEGQILQAVGGTWTPVDLAVSVAFSVALPVGANTVDTAPAANSGVEWTLVLIKGVNHRVSLLTAVRDGGGAVTFAESQVLVAPAGTYDVTVTASGGFGGITAVVTPASTGWSVRGIRRILA